MRHEEKIAFYGEMLDKAIKDLEADISLLGPDTSGQLHDIYVAKSVIGWVLETDPDGWKEQLETLRKKDEQ